MNRLLLVRRSHRERGFGDNLKWLHDRKAFPDAKVDLVYLDPPAWTKPLCRGEGPPFNSRMKTVLQAPTAGLEY